MSFISTKFMSAIHIHDFVDEVVADQNQSDNENYIEIHTDVNIFQEDFFYDFRIIIESIHCFIHTYITQFHHELYSTNVFFYVNDQFATTVIEDKLQVIDSVDHGNDEITEQFQCCYFELHTSIYNSLKTDHIDFTLNCYFGNGRQ